MDLERRQSDRAHLDKTFRAAHSLKGAAAMVGLASIAEFTHGIEAVLERIRAGMLAVDSDIITTLLEARDHLAAMVEAEAARSPIPPSSELTQRLASLLRGPDRTGPGANTGAGPGSPLPPPSRPQVTGDHSPPASSPAAPSASSPPASTGRAIREEAGNPPQADPGSPGRKPPPSAKLRSTRGKAPSAGEPEASAKPKRAPRKIAEDGPSSGSADRCRPGRDRGWKRRPGGERLSRHIRTRPGRPPSRGQSPGRSGRASRARRNVDCNRPRFCSPLDQLDPERCYLSWTITVKTDADPEQIREAFLFFAEDSTVSIQRRLPDGRLVPIPIAAAPEPGGSTALPPGRFVATGTVPGAGHPPAEAVPLAAAPTTTGPFVPTAPAAATAAPQSVFPAAVRDSGLAATARPDSGRCRTA